MSYRAFTWAKAKHDFAFLRLQYDTVAVDLTDYPVPPIAIVLSMLVWIAQQSQD